MTTLTQVIPSLTILMDSGYSLTTLTQTTLTYIIHLLV